jgi:hypothetical protein
MNFDLGSAFGKARSKPVVYWPIPVCGRVRKSPFNATVSVVDEGLAFGRVFRAERCLALAGVFLAGLM